MRILMALAALGIMALPGYAQQLSGDTVPKELVSALLRGPGAYSGESFDLRVGPAPADFPLDVLPGGTVVALTAVSERSTTVVGTAVSLNAANRDEALSKIGNAGWSNPTPARRGFTTGMDNQVYSLCRDHDFVSLSFLPRAEGGSYVRASLSRDARRQCVPRPMGMETFFADINVPALVPPADSRSVGGGGGGGSDYWTSQARLVVKLGLPAIADHYRRQLIDAGWKVQGKPIDVDGLSLTHFLVPSRAGDPLVGLLTVAAIPGSPQIDLMLRVVRPADDRGFGRDVNSATSLIIRHAP